MAKLKIVKVGDDVLRKKCRPVEEITPKIIRLLDDMTQTMRDAQGVGLAAPQVGILRRIVVIEVEEGNVIELINPKIIAYAGEKLRFSAQARQLLGNVSSDAAGGKTDFSNIGIAHHKRAFGDAHNVRIHAADNGRFQIHSFSASHS